MNVTVIHEVWTDTVGSQLGLQWCRYPLPSAVLYGYRFVWRDDQVTCRVSSDHSLLENSADWAC